MPARTAEVKKVHQRGATEHRGVPRLGGPERRPRHLNRRRKRGGAPWGVQKGYAVLPKSTKPDRLRQNRDLFSFSIDAEDMAAIATMDRGDGVAWPPGDPTKVA